MAIKHTPGPWSCHGKRPTEVWSPCGSIMVADCKPEPRDREHREQAVANAKLIASAPDLAAENARLRGELDRLFAGDAPAQTVRAENTRLRAKLALAGIDPDREPVAAPCGNGVAGTQNSCTRPRGHAGACRCNAGDVDDRNARRGEFATSDKTAIRQPAPDVQAALADALEQVKAALGDRLLGNGPLSKEYAHSVMRQINAALTLAGRKP